MEKGKAVAAVYPEQFDPEFPSVFGCHAAIPRKRIPVPEIFAVDGQSVVIVRKDLVTGSCFVFYDAAPNDECDDYKQRP